MKPILHVSYGPIPPMACPACHAVLHSATGFSPAEAVVPTAGAQTLCDRCFTWCTFVYQAFPTPGLRLRRATRDEVDSLDASLRELVEQCGTFLHRDDRKQ